MVSVCLIDTNEPFRLTMVSPTLEFWANASRLLITHRLPKQFRREFVKIVPPVGPRVLTSGDPQVVLKPALHEDLGEGFRAGHREVLVSDDDLQTLNRAIGRVLCGEEVFVLLLPLLGVATEDAGPRRGARRLSPRTWPRRP